MSRLSGSSAALHAVQLYRYDLSMGMARTMGMALIGRQMEGIWHTSIVVYGAEFYFDGGVGIVEHKVPGQTRFGAPYRTEVLGQTSKSESDWRTWVRAQGRAGAFGPADYHLLEKNCNHFTQAASRFLLARDIPADIREMIPTLLSTPMGRSLFPVLQNISSAGEAAPPTTSLHSSSPPSSATVGRTSAAGQIEPGAASSWLRSSKDALSEEEESDLLTCQAMLESHPLLLDGNSHARAAGQQTILAALQLLHTIVSNVIRFPAETKYRTISTRSKAYMDKLKELEASGVTEMLRLAGFELRDKQHTTNANTATGQAGQEMEWHLSDERGSRAVLEHVALVIQNTMSNVRRSAV